MIAIDMYGWMTIGVWILCFWAGCAIALVVAHKRMRDSQPDTPSPPFPKGGHDKTHSK